ncbi:hypothetical protein CVD28_04515 [Bacillus sp. M6-12]|uniref:Flp family type IVb pilin n=1 Tax=Bacillus sp. M6-12 TaxID=2054166 RepID=UPI000C77F297|nr:hypothetical protein [Bacillus sp. M6-12]PLS19682.1 hypothetical protein CVD28_04515 [Bacillus sp. M6-12]
MKNIKKFLKDQKGAFSILFVILAFISVLIITWSMDVLKQSYTISEVQGIMDVAGVSALNYSVDKESLRGEEFIYSEDAVRTKYHDIIEKRIHAGGSQNISYKQVRIRRVDYKYTNEGLGERTKPAHQLWLDSYMVVRVKTSQVFDLFPSLEKQFYDSFDKNNFDISVTGQTEDGKTELVIRSVSRLVYR